MPAGRSALPTGVRRGLSSSCVLASERRAGRLLPARSYHFQTVSTDRVSVHFHQGFEAMARQAASMATEILSWHEARYGQKVGRVQIVIVDADDQSNGFASPLPFPLVTIRAVAPDGTDDFGNHEGWLRLVLTHELAHTVHLEESRGLWGFGRKLFGRAPFLFPNTLAMSWMIEGLATYEETELTAFGRGRNPDSRMVIRMAALEGRFPKEDQAIYALDAWPGGQVPYLFGEAFLRRLTEQSGEDAIPKMGRQHAGQFPPFLDGRTVSKVTGTGLHAHWTAWATQATEAAERDADEREARGLTPSRPVTARGIRQVSPRFSPDGAWVAYTSRTLTRFPQIRLARPDGSEDHRLALRNGGSGLAWTPDGKSLVYAELQVHATFSVFGDLSLVDVASGDVRRLTRGVRAYDPDVSPDGRRIVFARKMGDRSELFTVGLDGRGLEPLTTSVAGVEWSGPRWSPAGDAIVAARLLPGGWLDLVRVDPATGAVEQLTHDRAKDVEPTWTPDGEAVVFRSDRDGVSNLHALRLADRSVLRVGNVLGGAFQPSVSPDGLSVACSTYSSRGYDVVVAPLDLGAAPAAPAFVDTLPAPRPDPLPASGAVEALPRLVDAPAALLDAVGADRGRREPLRPRHRRLGRALPPRVGRARHVRDGVRARQRERLLPVRPLPADLPRERSGHDRRLHRRPAADPAGRACRPRCRCAAPCAPSRRSRPPGGASARRCWAATARRTASTSAASRRPGRSPRRSRTPTRSRRSTAGGCASPGCTRRRRSAATSRSTS